MNLCCTNQSTIRLLNNNYFKDKAFEIHYFLVHEQLLQDDIQMEKGKEYVYVPKA